MLKAKIRFSERLCVTRFSLVFAGFRWRLLRQRCRVFAAAKRESELKHEQGLSGCTPGAIFQEIASEKRSEIFAKLSSLRLERSISRFWRL